MQKKSEGVTLWVKIIPKASTTSIVGWEGDLLKIRVKAVPEKGQANQELIDYLAKYLKIAKSKIKIIYGLTSRKKRIFIEDATIDNFLKES